MSCSKACISQCFFVFSYFFSTVGWFFAKSQVFIDVNAWKKKVHFSRLSGVKMQYALACLLGGAFSNLSQKRASLALLFRSSGTAFGDTNGSLKTSRNDGVFFHPPKFDMESQIDDLQRGSPGSPVSIFRWSNRKFQGNFTMKSWESSMGLTSPRPIYGTIKGSWWAS